MSDRLDELGPSLRGRTGAGAAASAAAAKRPPPSGDEEEPEPARSRLGRRPAARGARAPAPARGRATSRFPRATTSSRATPDGRAARSASSVARFNGEITTRLLDASARRARGGGRRARDAIDGHAGPRRLRAAARGDGAREDEAVRLHRRARLRGPRRDAPLRLHRRRGRERPAARGDRDGCAGRVRCAHGRRRASRRRRGSTGPRMPCAPPSRWRMSSPSFASAAGQPLGSL